MIAVTLAPASLLFWKPNVTDGTTGAQCANCGAGLAGRYCSACGQRADHGLPTVAHLLGETVEMLSHADSRLWRTLLPLVARPGVLTREFLAGHRARYLPPLRLYLVLSVLFFLAMGLSPGSEEGGIHVGSSGPPAAAPAAAKAQSPGEATPCDFGIEVAGKQWIVPRLQHACERIREDDGREFSHSFLHNLGRAMFLFLPVLAGLMVLLYRRPRRFYFEHLLLLLHNHAATFLLVSLLWLAEAALPWRQVDPFLGLPLTIYLLAYYYRSMRMVYGQGRVRTFAKYLALAGAYAFGAILMLVVTAMFSALTM
jgi:hypothetical protein